MCKTAADRRVYISDDINIIVLCVFVVGIRDDRLRYRCIKSINTDKLSTFNPTEYGSMVIILDRVIF